MKWLMIPFIGVLTVGWFLYHYKNLELTEEVVEYEYYMNRLEKSMERYKKIQNLYIETPEKYAEFSEEFEKRDRKIIRMQLDLCMKFYSDLDTYDEQTLSEINSLTIEIEKFLEWSEDKIK